MIYFTYGIVKTASTYCNFLIRKTFQTYCENFDRKFFNLADLDPRLQHYWIPDEYNLDKFLSYALDKVGTGKDAFVVAKTHMPATSKIRNLLKKKKIFACSTFRHPGDIALSLLDAAKVDKKKGIEKRFDGIKNLEVAFRVIDMHITNFETWHSYGTVPIKYSSLTLNPLSVINMISRQTNITVDAQEVLSKLPKKENIPEYNIGVQERRIYYFKKVMNKKIDHKYKLFLDKNKL